MSTRIPVMAPSTRQTFGLFAIIESKRVVLPLKGVECDFSIISGLAEVSMTQIFRQENTQALDCEYLFPLPADASVYFCEADINGRTIRAQVRERQEARRIAAEKKAAGFRTALVEAERENLFTLSLGNIQPGDLVIVQLKYFQTLRFLAEAPSIEIPFCPGIRYIPGKPLVRSNKGKGIIDDTDEVPDASRITPVRIDAQHPDAAYIEVRGTLEGKYLNENEVTSPSHTVTVQRTGKEVRVSLSDKGDVPDRDFVLRWSEKKAAAVASRAWIREKADAAYALLEIRAPKVAPAERAPVDFYFLVDRSGSMRGAKWSKAAQALQSCVKVLGPADRVMVTFFETEFQDFAERPLSPQELIKDREFQRIEKLGTAGGTEMRPALKHVLELAVLHSREHCKNLILITDAQIGNETAILELMKTAPDFPAHCFGIDMALNDSLLLALSRQQGGTFQSLNPNDDIEKAVTSLGETLGQPVLLGLKLSKGWEPAEAAIPNLYAGQIRYLSAKRSSPGVPLALQAQNAASQPVTIQFEELPATLDAAYLHWCRSRIQRLVAEENNRAAIQLSVESNLICTLTAFIAWDESEKVTIASHQLVQPSMELCDMLLCRMGPVELQQEKSAAYAPVVLEPRAFGLGQFQRASFSRARRAASVEQDELTLKRDLSDLCHKTGVTDWQLLVKAIFDWVAAAKEKERATRLRQIENLLQELKDYAAEIQKCKEAQKADKANEWLHAFEQRLKVFAEFRAGMKK